jgi:trans-aconitate 2-methyltransferase
MESPDPSPMVTWNPADYNLCSPVHLLWARDLIAKRGLLGFERVIDIGCGDGKVTAAIASTVPEGAVTGIDNSPKMIWFAQQHFPGTRHPNLTFIQMDARHLTFF